ncbi:MAG TPA: 2-oxoglutarate and iron-dependent oxygenase domain-containing protein [Ilumatobacteraceae bacterium]|nr:2-oxoglutarate and iron-dependent oxygenase domain-containing protein [Ilumatobacteraceae bacterium]
MTTTIPTFSLADWRSTTDERRTAAELVSMCHGVGFLYLTDHGVPREFIDHYFGLLRDFFALPEATKALIDKRQSPHFRGWERTGAELTGNRVDFREQLDVSTEYSPYAPDVEPAYLHLDGPNQWLPEVELPGFHAAIEEFFDRLGAVAWELMEVMSVGLGLPRDQLRHIFGERPLSFAKLISYPRTPTGEAGVNPHHDAGFLTLLLQHGVGGLQALAPDGEWIDVAPPPDGIIVNIGEMLQAMTGNYFVACTHRVIATEPRFSTAYFHGPDLRTPLSPLDLHPRFAEEVAASPRHRSAGFMAKRDELLTGLDNIASDSAQIFGQQMWNYYVRSYPEMVEAHYPDAP